MQFIWKIMVILLGLHRHVNPYSFALYANVILRIKKKRNIGTANSMLFLQQKNGGKFDTLPLLLIFIVVLSLSIVLSACLLFSASILQRQQINFYWFRQSQNMFILLRMKSQAKKRTNKQFLHSIKSSPLSFSSFSYSKIKQINWILSALSHESVYCLVVYFFAQKIENWNMFCIVDSILLLPKKHFRSIWFNCCCRDKKKLEIGNRKHFSEGQLREEATVLNQNQQIKSFDLNFWLNFIWKLNETKKTHSIVRILLCFETVKYIERFIT